MFLNIIFIETYLIILFVGKTGKHPISLKEKRKEINQLKLNTYETGTNLHTARVPRHRSRGERGPLHKHKRRGYYF